MTDGHLKTGDVIATDSAFVRIKSLEDFRGEPSKEAFASDPVIVFGFDQTPKVGEEFRVFESLEAAENHISNSRGKEVAPEALEFTDQQKVLSLILKTDVLGSAEAVKEF